MSDFIPDFSSIEAGEPSEFARKMLIEFVKQYAVHKGVTQTKLAEMTGIHQPNLAQILSGKSSPGIDTFLKIASALNLHIDIRES